MEHLANKLKLILDYLADPGKGQYAGDKNICYLTFPFNQLLDVKKNLDSFTSMIKYYNYDCEVISLGKVVYNFVTNNPRHKNWESFAVAELREEMIDFFKGLSSTINENEIIENAILTKQEELLSKPKPLLLITDLEGIHPFTRFGPVEQKIYSYLQIPIIVLYPGDLSGSSLEYLGFYPPDGNYRSKHF